MYGVRVKVATILGSLAMLLGAMVTSATAGSFGIGITGMGLAIHTEGEETLKSNNVKTSATETSVAGVPSLYMQYTFGDDGFVIGINDPNYQKLMFEVDYNIMDTEMMDWYQSELIFI